MADQDNFKRSNNSVSNNPLLNEKKFNKIREMGLEGTMTVEGTVNKIGILFLLAVAAASYVGWQVLQGNQGILGLLLPALVVAAITGLIVIFKPLTAPYLAPVYALTYGVVLGGITATLEGQLPGIAVQACGLTLMTLAAMLTLYKTGIIRATPAFKRIMFVAMMAVLLMVVVNAVMYFCGHPLWVGFGSSGSRAAMGHLDLWRHYRNLCLQPYFRF